jgi:hypothetical protein
MDACPFAVQTRLIMESLVGIAEVQGTVSRVSRVCVAASGFEEGKWALPFNSYSQRARTTTVSL